MDRFRCACAAVRTTVTLLIILQLINPITSQSGRDSPAILHFLREVQENYNLDLVFILDSSPYVPESSFYETEREIVRQVIQQFLYIAPERTRVTVVTYSSSVKVVLDDITNGGDKLKCDFVENFEVWREVQYHSQETSSGSTNLAGAFDAVRTIMGTGRQNRAQIRPRLKQVALLLTSGKFFTLEERDEAKRKALSLQQGAGVLLHAVAMDRFADYNAVRDLLQIKDFISYSSEWPPALANQFNNIGSRYTIGKTTSGTAGSQACHFPFLYKSTLYTSCTTRDNNGVPWCATTPEYQDVWGVCVVDSAEDLRPYNISSAYACNCKGGTQCVCDVVKGFSKCLCPPGQTWTSSGCKNCPSGTYKSTFGDKDCEICPPGGVTSEGAKRRNQCLCGGTACYDECKVRDHCTGKNQECVTSQGSQSVECRCLKGYTGSSCNLVKDQCQATPCASGSICIDAHEDYICVCTTEQYGKNCTQSLSSCSAQCPGDAECRVLNGQSVCQCRRGYTLSGNACIQANHPVTTFQPPPPARPSTVFPINPVTPTVTQPGPRQSINDVVPEDATDDSKATASDSSRGILGLNGRDKRELMLLITIPVCVVAFIAVASTIYALYSVSHNKKQRQRRSRSNSRVDTTSEVTQFTTTTTVSMSDLKKKHEGFNVNMDAVYGNEPVEYGMGEWYYYTLDLIHNGILNTVAIVRLDGKKWILSPGCYLYKEEIETIYSALTQKSNNVRLSYQRKEYGVINNDDMLMVAHSTSSDSQQEILSASKTRQFVVICTASFAGDEGKCKIETQRLREHIKSQGL